MSGAGAAAGSTAAVAAAIANAVKASGVLVRIEPQEFTKILKKCEAPLIVYHEGGVFGTTYKYLMSYKGLAFFTKTKEPLYIPASAEVVVADAIWMPS